MKLPKVVGDVHFNYTFIVALCQLSKAHYYVEHLPGDIMLSIASQIQFQWCSFAKIGWSLEDTQQSGYSNAVVLKGQYPDQQGTYQKGQFLALTPVHWIRNSGHLTSPARFCWTLKFKNLCFTRYTYSLPAILQQASSMES